MVYDVVLLAVYSCRSGIFFYVHVACFCYIGTSFFFQVREHLGEARIFNTIIVRGEENKIGARFFFFF